MREIKPHFIPCKVCTQFGNSLLIILGRKRRRHPNLINSLHTFLGKQRRWHPNLINSLHTFLGKQCRWHPNLINSLLIILSKRPGKCANFFRSEKKFAHLPGRGAKTVQTLNKIWPEQTEQTCANFFHSLHGNAPRCGRSARGLFMKLILISTPVRRGIATLNGCAT